MIVLISGASGLIGRALVPALRARGIEPRLLVRRAPSGPHEIPWDPAQGRLDASALAGGDAIVNLAGRSLAGRWTAQVKSAMVDSRVRATRLLVEAAGAMPAPPSVLVSASAIGFYGDRGDEVLTEVSSPGTGFLADLARAWEGEARRAAEFGVRVVLARFGLVMGRGGGALGPLLPLFRCGLGGPLGGGRQWWSWIHLDDVVAAIITALEAPALTGPINVAGPAPVTNREFTRALAASLRRPAILPAPAFALRLVLGEMADEMILGSQRVIPARLQAAGFTFRWPELGPALQNLVS